MRRNNFKLSKFLIFKKPSKLLFVQCTATYHILIFESKVLVLNKKTFAEIKTIKGSYSKVVQTGRRFFLYKIGESSFKRFCPKTQKIEELQLPPNQFVTHVSPCSEKRFLIVVTTFITNQNKTNLLFWPSKANMHLFSTPFNKKIDRVMVRSPKQLVVFFKTGISLFDVLKMKSERMWSFDWEVEDAHFLGTQKVLVKFKTKGFYLFDPASGEKKKVASLGKKVHQVYMSKIGVFWAVSDLDHMHQVEL